MPQMSPLWWEMLYIIFIMMFMIMIIIMYYNKNFKLKSIIYNKKINQLNWKW
uniref:ATP synthase F0 subunit 8 n=1 Tax=Rhopalus nigricornis TaxID=3151526 RepID=A0AAU7YRW0_9HEMI